MATYYEILEVSPNASIEVIEKAYKVLAKKYHPDLNPSENRQRAEETMKYLNIAYETLKDDYKRHEYDNLLCDNNYAEDHSDNIPLGKNGIKGFLLIFVISVIINLIYMFTAFRNMIVVYIDSFYLFELYYKISVTFCLSLLALYFPMAILTLVQLIRKNLAGKYSSIIYCFYNIFISLLTIIAIQGTPIADAIYTLIWGMLWILYFNKSKRVKNTLTNRSNYQWAKPVASVGGVFLAIGYIGGIILHIYTVYIAYTYHGLLGAFASLMLPAISEIYFFIRLIIDTGTFYNYYSILSVFYIMMTYVLGMFFNYLSTHMESDAF